jgi:hypothetical protein
MKLTIQKGGIPAGVYRVRYGGGEEMETKFGAAYKLCFSVIGGEFDGKETSRLVNPKSSSPKANISVFFAALAGVDAEDGVNIDDDLFIGCEYEILVEAHGDEGFTKVGTIIRRLEEDAKTTDEQAADLF